jgi:drug/metabolite transporter (DMT)-like permease
VHAAVEVQHLAETLPGLTIGRAFGIGWLWLGIALLTIDLAALLAMLSVENVSLVIPMTALSYVVGALGGAFFLAERVGPARWMGVLIVCAGVALVFAGRR